MRTARFVLIVWGLMLAGTCEKPWAQSLAELARKEAERRRELDRQGVTAKVISGDPALLAPGGNLSTSSPAPRFAPAAGRGEQSGRGSSRSYRSGIQKLDREIRSVDDRLATLRARLQAEKWAIPKVGRAATPSSGSTSQQKMEWQIRDLEIKLKRLRQDRIELYDEGRRAGYQPGELDGKGQVP